MTVYQNEEILRTENTYIATAVSTDDEIDIRRYLRVLVDWWKEIVVFTIMVVLLVGLTIFGVRYFTAPLYQSTSTVAIVRVSSDVTFDERFRTQSDESLAVQRATLDSKRATLLGLVDSGAIAEAVILYLGDLLSEDEAQPDTLREMISASLVTGSGGRVESDLIQITATATSPEKAASIANAWANIYVEQVNGIYGQMPQEVLDSVDLEVANAEKIYQSAQGELEEFLASNQVKKVQRLLDEKRGIINSLQIGKQTAVDTIVDEELKARSEIISAYIQALSDNRLLAFTKEQQGKRKMLEVYMDAEIQNRLKAIEEDRKVRETFFKHVADAQLASATAVFDQQIQSRIELLNQLYIQKNRFQVLLGQAKLLETQIAAEQAGSSESNGLALALLKAQVMILPELTPVDKFTQEEPKPQQIIVDQPEPKPTSEAHINATDSQAPVVNVPVVSVPVVNVAGDASQPRSQVQVNVDIANAATSDPATQQIDIANTIKAITQGLAELEQRIQGLSQELISGDEYALTDQFLAAELGISSSVTQTLTSISEPSARSSISRQVVERYADLFNVGQLAANASEPLVTSDLFSQIRELYPDLFQLGELSELTDNIPDNNPLAMISVTKAKELLQLDGLEDIPSYTASAEPLIQAINQLDSETQQLEAQLEAESARQRQLIQLRDLAWDSFKTLSTKKAELDLAQSVTNSEVRMASPAVAPFNAIKGPRLITNIIIAGVVAFVLGILLALIADLLDQRPFLKPRFINTQPINS
ncbi:MAG: hypothetical protein R3A44_29435 [Caldilineaceae bacterium]